MRLAEQRALPANLWVGKSGYIIALSVLVVKSFFKQNGLFLKEVQLQGFQKWHCLFLMIGKKPFILVARMI